MGELTTDMFEADASEDSAADMPSDGAREIDIKRQQIHISKYNQSAGAS